MWWDDRAIESTVTRRFVLSKLLPDEQARLDEPLGFGNGLTDNTYMDWIDQKAKRLFLILVELEVPDQIFGVIDDSWDDADLPLRLEQVPRLRLTPERDEKLERKFYQRQFAYLLKHMQYGDRIRYEEDDVVPIELVDKKVVPGLPPSNMEKVCLPNEPDQIFIRRRITLGLGPGEMPVEEFISGVEQKRCIHHKHLVQIWASYVHKDYGYLLLTPVSDGTLKGFLNMTPPSIKAMAKRDRQVMFLNWIHCLVSALASLHQSGLAHRKIKPSNIMLDSRQHIYLNDSGILTQNQSTDGKKYFDKESYDYAAPEQWEGRPASSSPPARFAPQPIARHQSRNAPPPGTPRPLSDQNLSLSRCVSPTTNATSYNTEAIYTIPFHPSRPDPRKSDIFSLGCVMVDIISALLKKPSRAFAAHRGAKNKMPGRGGGLPDSAFHKNLDQVAGWIGILAKEANKKDDKLFKGVSHILQVVSTIIAVNPKDRPDASVVRDKIGDVLKRISGIEELCCNDTVGMMMPPPRPIIESMDDLEITTIEGQPVNSDREQRFSQSSSFIAGNMSPFERLSLNTSRGASRGEGNSTPTSPRQSSMGGGNADLRRMSSVQERGWKAKAPPKAWQAPVYAGA
jgi:serine/threonine protein kinase